MCEKFCNNKNDAKADLASIPTTGGQIRVWNYSTGEMDYYAVDEDTLTKIVAKCEKHGDE